ncbi:DCN1-like protein 2 [Iris pallida]|uniref:Defective in cullin neddylation protein n=1 Tax=Iris pallida TaxID=29817 RepID=A0AAX6FF97_IRIPA|nr:DCN1-like protein 2 [Iris pallida]
MIMVEGISRLCNDLQVDPEDIVMFLVVSWHMKAATMCEFSRQEFVSGLQSLGVDSLEKFREKIPSIRAEVKMNTSFARYTTSHLYGLKRRAKNLWHWKQLLACGSYFLLKSNGL